MATPRKNHRWAGRVGCCLVVCTVGLGVGCGPVARQIAFAPMDRRGDLPTPYTVDIYPVSFAIEASSSYTFPGAKARFQRRFAEHLSARGTTPVARGWPVLWRSLQSTQPRYALSGKIQTIEDSSINGWIVPAIPLAVACPFTLGMSCLVAWAIPTRTVVHRVEADVTLIDMQTQRVLMHRRFRARVKHWYNNYQIGKEPTSRINRMLAAATDKVFAKAANAVATTIASHERARQTSRPQAQARR